MHHSPQLEPTNGFCKRLVMAKGVICDIEFCPSCNQFHVNVGAVSLRLQPTALRDLAVTLHAALEHYQRVALLCSQDVAVESPQSDEVH